VNLRRVVVRVSGDVGGVEVGVDPERECDDDVLKRDCTEARDSALRRRPKKQPLRAEAASLSGRWRSGSPSWLRLIQLT
jgi:hypothetical protein